MEKYKLSNETIDIISEEITKMYADCKSNKKDTLRARLLLEEALLKYQHVFGEDVNLTFRRYDILGQARFVVRIASASFDPFTLEENPMAFMIQSILTNIETGMPTWKYRNMENEIVFTIKKKREHGALQKIGISALIALVLGLLARQLLPGNFVSTFVADYVVPLSNAYSGLFCVMAVLLTLFAITLSIVHVGDMKAIGNLGGKIIKTFIIAASVCAIIFTVPILPFLNISSNVSTTISAKSIYDILIGFIPVNLVTPFIDFNSIHIMIIGAMFGFSLLAMGQKGETLTKVFDECNLVAVYTNNFVNKFIYLYIGLKVFEIVTVSDFSELADAGRIVAVILAAEFIIFAFYTLYAKTKSKKSLKEICSAAVLPFTVCLSSANFGAAFNNMFDALEKEVVDLDTANLAVNIGSVFFQPCCTVVLAVSALFMANRYGLDISVMWIVTDILLSVILVSAMPNIPGASVSALTLLYAQLGLPAEALALMIAVNAVLQFVTVGVDAWCLCCETIGFDRTMKEKQKSN